MKIYNYITVLAELIEPLLPCTTGQIESFRREKDYLIVKYYIPVKGIRTAKEFKITINNLRKPKDEISEESKVLPILVYNRKTTELVKEFINPLAALTELGLIDIRKLYNHLNTFAKPSKLKGRDGTLYYATYKDINNKPKSPQFKDMIL